MSQGLNVNKKALDNVFCGWNREVLISWPEWKASLKISAEVPVDVLVILTPEDEEYFCVEPVSHLTDAFNLLDRGDSWTGEKILLLDEILEAKIIFVPELDSNNSRIAAK